MKGRSESQSKSQKSIIERRCNQNKIWINHSFQILFECRCLHFILLSNLSLSVFLSISRLFRFECLCCALFSSRTLNLLYFREPQLLSSFSSTYFIYFYYFIYYFILFSLSHLLRVSCCVSFIYVFFFIHLIQLFLLPFL